MDWLVEYLDIYHVVTILLQNTCRNLQFSLMIYTHEISHKSVEFFPFNFLER